MRGGAVALAVTCVATSSCVAYVHWEQKRDLRRMQASVLYDVERESIRRRFVEEQKSVESAMIAPARQPSHSKLAKDVDPCQAG